jgi:hypothetical protein
LLGLFIITDSVEKSLFETLIFAGLVMKFQFTYVLDVTDCSLNNTLLNTSTHGREEMCIQNFGRKTVRKGPASKTHIYMRG